MKAVKGKYEKGIVKLSEPADVPEGLEVYIIFPERIDEKTLKIVSWPPRELIELSGFISIGGDALKDTESIYDE